MRIKRLLYVPGLFSLIGLPILLFVIHPEKDFKTVVRINIPSNDKRIENRFSEAAVISFVKTKQVEQIDMNDEILDDRTAYLHRRKKKFLIHEIERLQFATDTNRILKIHFGKRNTYGDFMFVLNLARIYLFDRYILMNEDFYFIANEPSAKVDSDADIQENETGNNWQYHSPTTWDYLEWNVAERWITLVEKLRENPFLICGFNILILAPALLSLVFRLKMMKEKNLQQ